MTKRARYLLPTLLGARRSAAAITVAAGGALLLSGAPVTAEQDQLSVLPPAGAAPADVTLHYEVMVGGLHATSLQFSLSLEENGSDEELYHGRFKAWAEGMLSWIVDFEMASEISGKLSSSGFSPERYQARSAWGGNERTVAMTFDDSGLPDANVVPQPERPPVPAEYRDGKLDPLSTLLTLIYGAAAGGCNDQVEAYDGRRIYRVATKNAANVVLPKSGSNVYEGPATACQVSVDRELEVWRGENTPGKPKKRYLQDITAYFAPIAEGFPSLPVRLEAESGFGGARAHLVKIERN